MKKNYLYCENGPLRVNIIPSIAKGFNWSISDRFKLYQLLFTLSTNQKHGSLEKQSTIIQNNLQNNNNINNNVNNNNNINNSSSSSSSSTLTINQSTSSSISPNNSNNSSSMLNNLSINQSTPSPLNTNTKSSSKNTLISSKSSENHQKIENRIIFEFQKLLLSIEIDCAFASLVHVGPLFIDQGVNIESLNWATRIDHEYHTLRSLLSFQFKRLIPSFINNTYKHPKSELYIHAIFDQLIYPFEKDSSSNYWQIHSLFIKNQQTIKHNQNLIPKREALITNKLDHEFTNILLENVGVFIFFIFINIVHPCDNIRKRALQFLRRLVPIKFGKDQNRGSISSEQQEILHQIDSIISDIHFSSQFIEKITEKSFQLSIITSNYCYEFTNMLFNESIRRMPAITSDTQKLWSLQFLLPWCDHINLTKTEEEINNKQQQQQQQTSDIKNINSQSPRVQKQENNGENIQSQIDFHREDDGFIILPENTEKFLEKIFKYLTQGLVQGKFKIPSELIVFWQRLAFAHPSNHCIIIDFLLKNFDYPSCRTLIIYLYRVNNPNEKCPSIDHLISPIKFQFNKEFFQKDISLNFNLFSKKENAIFHLKICNSIVTVLSDFVIGSFTLLLPYLHYILTWSFLLFNHPNEQSTISTFLSNLIVTFKKIFKRKNLISADDKIIHQLDKIQKFLDEKFLQKSNLRWQFFSNKMIHYDDIFYPDSLLSSNDDDDFGNENETSNNDDEKSFFVSEIVSCFSSCFKLIGADDINKAWADECLLWATSKFPYSIAVNAYELFYILNQEITIQQTNILLRNFIISMTLFQKAIDKYSIYILQINNFRELTDNKTSDTTSISLTATISSIRNILYLILSIFNQCLPNILKNDENFSFSLSIFWILITVLRISHPAYYSLRYKGLFLCKKFFENNFFIKLPKFLSLKQQHEIGLKKSNEWNFNGILPLIIQTLYLNDMEKISIENIIYLFQIPINDLILTCNNDNNHPNDNISDFQHLNLNIEKFFILFICILPWFHISLFENLFFYEIEIQQTSTSKKYHNFIDQIFFFYDNLFNNSKKNSSFHVILQKFLSGDFIHNPDQFIENTIEYISKKISLSSISIISGLFFLFFGFLLFFN